MDSFPNHPPLVMGVLNVTPDSFSDGGQYTSQADAIAHAEQMLADGADWIDVGGESTKPGSQPIPPDEQLRRILPIVTALAPRATLSIDTTSSHVAQKCLDAGAKIINDVSAGRNDARMFPLVARTGATLVLMHMQGTPQTMQVNPQYSDVVREVSDFLVQRRSAAVEARIPIEQIYLDPGIGFGKTVEHNLMLLRELRRLADLGSPLVVGTSRKGFIGRITGESMPQQRLFGTAATVAWSVANGASVVRVHDVKAMVQVVRMTRALMIGRADHGHAANGTERA